jgi:hypothetical protein
MIDKNPNERSTIRSALEFGDGEDWDGLVGGMTDRSMSSNRGNMYAIDALICLGAKAWAKNWPDKIGLRHSFQSLQPHQECQEARNEDRSTMVKGAVDHYAPYKIQATRPQE